MDNNKQKALDAALGQIERQFGKGSVMRLGDAEVGKGIESISTGSLGLDIALGIGGLPRGRVVEIYGPESSGKTTLTLSVIAQAQKTGGTCAFIDAEHALDFVCRQSTRGVHRVVAQGGFVAGVTLADRAGLERHLHVAGPARRQHLDIGNQLRLDAVLAVDDRRHADRVHAQLV